jgi:hypothetical protein
VVAVGTRRTVPAFAQESTESITVTAEKLAAARNGMHTQTGAPTYTITADDIQPTTVSGRMMVTSPGQDTACLIKRNSSAAS